jgi:transcription elongation GreA/GreB family factor
MYQLTLLQFKELEEKFSRLTGEKYDQLNEDWRLAVGEGDDRETDALTVALDLLHNHHFSVKDIREILDNTEIIKIHRTTKVKVGTKVTLEIDGCEFVYEIVDPSIADTSKNRISFKSPLGEFLIGSKIGEYSKTINSNRKSIHIKKIEICD